MSRAGVFVRWALLTLSLVAPQFVARFARAETVWERVRRPMLAADSGAVALSLQRTLSGASDSTDELRLRTAFVALARGRLPATQVELVLLLRVRRQLRLPTPPGALDALEATLARPTSVYVRSLAALEAAYLARESNQTERAAQLAAQAFETSWRSDLAGEARLVHGWLELQAGHMRQAKRDFLLAVAAADGQKSLALALLSLAVVEAESGAQADASRLAVRAEAVMASRANASGAGIFSDGELDAAAQRAVLGLPARVGQLSEPER